jgi:ribosomal protein S18 acetylase RimI-like enzyme
MNEIKIIEAGLAHLDEVVALFDDYRVFYEQESNRRGAREFIEARMKQGESVIFLAIDEADGRPLGFTQLYPTYSSVSMKPQWILNDLYVDAAGRRRGVGWALMERAREHAIETGAKGLVLETAVDNTPAQRLYEQCGWERDEEFYRYALRVDKKPDAK